MATTPKKMKMKEYEGTHANKKKRMRHLTELLSSPTHPRASTREQAVVGVGGTPRPINDFVLPCERKVETRGVTEVGNRTGAFKFDVSIIVEGVRVESVGDGGKTKRVWDEDERGTLLLLSVGTTEEEV
jgi:hypothetical protein